MNNLINNSNPEEMIKVSKKIALYADNLRKDMKKLMNTHQVMRTNWSGKQYDDFTKVIEEANKSIDKQIEKLINISTDVEKDAKQLQMALNANMR